MLSASNWPTVALWSDWVRTKAVVIASVEIPFALTWYWWITASMRDFDVIMLQYWFLSVLSSDNELTCVFV